MSGPEDDGPRRMAWWETLRADMAAEADAYETEGWDTLQLHPGDVTPLDGEFGDDVGLDVLVPDDEFAALESTLSDGVDGYEVFRTTHAGYVVLLIVVENHSRKRAVFLPAYYGRNDEAAVSLFETAIEDGELAVFVRTLADDRIELTLREPELLAPPDD